MRIVIAAVALLLLASRADAVTRNVPADYATIQLALNAATSGDLVLVAPGTYHEHLVFGAGQSGVKLHSSSGAPTTVLDADGTNFCIDITNASGVEVVGFTIQNGVRSGLVYGGGLVVEGSSVTITDNLIQNCSACWGGGIYVDPASSAMILRNTIRDNSCCSSGGGIYYRGRPGQIDGNVIANNVSASSCGGLALAPDMAVTNNHFLSNSAESAGALSVFGSQVVRGNEFRGNSARFSGAVYVGGSAVVDSNTFVGNSATERGGALEAYGTSLISRNVFLDNSSQLHGGAIYTAFSGNDPIIRGNVIARNSSPVHGGGVMIDYYGYALLENNTIVLNSAPTGGGVLLTQSANATLRRDIVSHTQTGGGVVCDATSGVLCLCSDVWGNTGSNYSGLADPTGTQGNISGDPMYCSLASLDFHLASQSPCSPAHSGGFCNLIGALDVNCEGPVRTQPTTWGSIKAQYH